MKPTKFYYNEYYKLGYFRKLQLEVCNSKRYARKYIIQLYNY
jgi:hypothetical protein